MRPIFPLRTVICCVVALVLLTSIPITWTAFSTEPGLRYTIDPSGHNDSVRVAPISLMWVPRIAVGLPQPNRSATVYVLGLNPANNTGNTSCARPANASCAPLVVIRSLDGGKSFETPETTNTDLPGWSVDTVVLPNGTLVAASWGPWILVSTDSGTTWNVTATLGYAGAPTSLARDPVTGTLYAVWAPHTVWEIIQGPILMSASHDGGYHWSTPVQILPAIPGGLYPEVAAYGNHVVVALSYDVVPTYIAVITSPDGGASWSNVTNLSVADVGYQMPSVAVSSQGIFAVTWSQDGAVVVSVSMDNGSTWGSPSVVASVPGGGFGHSAVFDDPGRLYITWTSQALYSSNASLYVASSDRSLDRFNASSFSITFHSQVPTGVWYQENLAAAGEGNVFLTWESGDPSTPDAPGNGIFVRSVTGAVRGEIAIHGPLSAPSVTVELRDLATGATIRAATWGGTPVVFTDLAPDSYGLVVQVGNASAAYGQLPVQVWGLTDFTINIGPPAPSPALPFVVAAAMVAGVLLFASALSAIQYTRLAKENVLQRKVRALIYEHVRDNPGSSFSAIRDALGLQNGVAAYHLAVLENQGLLHSKIHRRHRWYYPDGDVSLWKELPLSPLQRSILGAVHGSPGAGVREIARLTGRRASSVAYNLEGLAREGILRRERLGRHVRYFPAEQPSSG